MAVFLAMRAQKGDQRNLETAPLGLCSPADSPLSHDPFCTFHERSPTDLLKCQFNESHRGRRRNRWGAVLGGVWGPICLQWKKFTICGMFDRETYLLQFPGISDPDRHVDPLRYFIQATKRNAKTYPLIHAKTQCETVKRER